MIQRTYLRRYTIYGAVPPNHPLALGLDRTVTSVFVPITIG